MTQSLLRGTFDAQKRLAREAHGALLHRVDLHLVSALGFRVQDLGCWGGVGGRIRVQG